MADNAALSKEEMERLVKEAEEKVQAMLAQMTPEERAQAQAKAEEEIAADQAAMRQMIADAEAVRSAPASHREWMERNTAQEHSLQAYPGAFVPKDAQNAVRFCPHCGASVSGGNFCEYCGGRL